MFKYLVMDVDGTLTDGKIYMSPSGELCKAFNIKDGCGIHDILIPNNITPVIITGRKSDIVLNRCKELGITEVYQGVNNKIKKLSEITSDLSSVAYIGDDINDLSCMVSVKEAGGKVGCPADAVKAVIEIADFVAEHNGGDGAVRDFIEWLVEENVSHNRISDHIYTGYFECSDDELKTQISKADTFNEFGLDEFVTEDNLDEGENPYEYASASVFLMGSCNLFALALNEKFGYTLCQIDKGSSHHYFCVTECVEKNGQKRHPLIDVRGITTDFFRFRSTSCVSTATIADVQKMVIDDDGLASDVIGIEYARRIIEKHPEFYDVQYLDKV